VATDSGDDGINVQSQTITLTHNRAMNNGDLGIEAVAGVIDGGRNLAHANGNPLIASPYGGGRRSRISSGRKGRSSRLSLTALRRS
jgi:hypothetical protein